MIKNTTRLTHLLFPPFYNEDRGICIVHAPPSTTNITPVVHAPALLAKNILGPARSSSEPILPNGIVLQIFSSLAPHADKPLLILEGTYPGAIALTVIFLFAKSAAIFLVK